MTEPDPALFVLPEPSPRYLIGYSGARKHAITEAELDAAQHRPRLGTHGLDTSGVCATPAMAITRWGTWAPTNPHLAIGGDRCPFCSWYVALTQGTTEGLLGSLDPTCAALCRAILNAEHGPRVESGDESFGSDEQALIELLAHATAHSPCEMRDDDCWEGGCDHDDDAHPHSFVCLTCSLVSGDWAGQWADVPDPRCVIESPCSVTTKLTERYLTAAGVSQ